VLGTIEQSLDRLREAAAIAEALFVTPKTVELRLRNAYRKLGAGKRGDLAALLASTP
jgi:DNA-binding NarL/FixJ family response regulator